MYVCYFYLGNFMATQWKSSCRVQGRRSTCRYCWYSCLFGWYWSHFLCLNRTLTIRDTLLTLWWTLTRISRWPRTSSFKTVLKTGCMGSALPFLSYLVVTVNCSSWSRQLVSAVQTCHSTSSLQVDDFFIQGWWLFSSRVMTGEELVHIDDESEAAREEERFWKSMYFRWDCIFFCT